MSEKRIHLSAIEKSSPAKFPTTDATSPTKKYFVYALLSIFTFSCSQLELRKISPSPRQKKSPPILKTVSKAPKKNLWRGLVVADEMSVGKRGCDPYNRKKDYDYPDLEDEIIKKNLGGRWYYPYTGETFKSKKESTIEHIVATKEAHRSGLCLVDRKIRLEFASDMDNLTLASSGLNSGEKKDIDAADWLPQLNKCWFVWTVVKVKLEYGLTVDEKEKNALEEIFRECKCDKKGRDKRNDKEC